MDIEGATFDGQITRFEHRQVLVRFYHGTLWVIEVALEIDINPTTEFESLEEIDLEDVPQILRARLRINTTHLSPVTGTPCEQQTDNGEGHHYMPGIDA